MNIILKAENISKQYRLGTVGTGTLSHDLNRWWHSIRGKEDPYLKIGGVNDRSLKASGDYVWALKDINFEVKQGEVLGIIGKNGAGKSTLLKILSRVTAPSTGIIKTKGRIASLLEVGTGFHPELTGRENIYLNGAILGMTKSEISSKLDEIIDFSGCEMYIDTPVKRYSSGMTVRLGFAVAAHLEPEILVVDEVLAVGDVDFQKKAIGKMKDLSKGQGRTVLFVSHNMNSVQSLCTSGILLENGGLKYSGSTEKTISEYLKRDKTTNNNLAILKNRKGAGNIVFSKISLTNLKRETSIFKLGEILGLHLDFQVHNICNLIRIKIIIGIYNEKEEGILRFDSSFSDLIEIDRSTKSGRISCITEDHLTIKPGKYYVNLALFNNGVLEDHIEDATMFDIINDNYIGNNKTVENNNLTSVIYKHTWKLELT